MLLKASMKEFGSNEQDLLLYAAKFLPEDVASVIRQDASSWTVKFNSYDLTINDTVLNQK